MQFFFPSEDIETTLKTMDGNHKEYYRIY